MSISCRFLRLQLVDGNVEAFIGPPIDTAIALIVDPKLTRKEWRYALEQLARPFARPRNAGDYEPLEQLAAKARAFPKLDPVTVTLVEVDFGTEDDLRAGTCRYRCSRAAYGTSARANLIVDASRFERVYGGGGAVATLLQGLDQWIANQPDPLPVREQMPRTPAHVVAQPVPAGESTLQ
jgi:hypothetical protein